MLGLVIGDAASGKSEYAESLVMKLSGKRIYAATMRNDGRESAERIEKHRMMRKDRGFVTFECPSGLGEETDLRIRHQEDFFEGACVLIEDLPNLVANEMFRSGHEGEAETDMVRRLFEEIMYLSGKSTHMIIVTGNLFTGGCVHDNITTDYLRRLAGLNNRLAEVCDEVYEVVCGIPVTLKGGKI